MENEIILLDTSILIEYYRKKDKSKSILFRLLKDHSIFAVSAVTHFEIYTETSNEQLNFWDTFFKEITFCHLMLKYHLKLLISIRI